MLLRLLFILVFIVAILVGGFSFFTLSDVPYARIGTSLLVLGGLAGLFGSLVAKGPFRFRNGNSKSVGDGIDIHPATGGLTEDISMADLSNKD